MISFVALKHKVKSSFSSNQELFFVASYILGEMAAAEMILRRGRRVYKFRWKSTIISLWLLN